ncbi:hypothetical protein HBA_0835 [Sodalis endosymbiont of Henestaris halophilus]|nr:hypothetical protein HBA_0835 [Sodalis endosymbiont of Henestaris halophilus]
MQLKTIRQYLIIIDALGNLLEQASLRSNSFFKRMHKVHIVLRV